MESEIMPEGNIRVSISMSPYDYRRLKIWAALHGKTPTAYAGQVVSARIEANFEEINKQVEDYAKAKNISFDEAMLDLQGGED